jgi:hypothetical protein
VSDKQWHLDALCYASPHVICIPQRGAEIVDFCQIFCVSSTYREFRYRYLPASTDDPNSAFLCMCVCVCVGGDGCVISIMLTYEKVGFE